MWGQIGGAIANFITASREAQSKKEWQEYNNKMVNLQNGMNQNAITQNNSIARQVVLNNRINLMRSTMVATAKVRANAAAAGVAGQSVENTVLGLNRNSTIAGHNQTIGLEREIAANEVKRIQSVLGASLQQDRSHIPTPNPMGLLAGIASGFTQGQQNQGPQSGGTQGLML